MKAKFLKCQQCNNIVEVVYESGIPMMCCGQKMEEVVPNTSDGAGEKHVPAVTIEKNVMYVKIGEVAHPMVEEHYIQWICVETENGSFRKVLTPDDAPEAVFNLGEEKPVAVYEYCNIHGLWKKEIK